MHDDAPLPPSLARAIDAMRELPEPRPEWTSALLAAADRQELETPSVAAIGRRWSLRPSVAIAAGLLFAALGSAVTYSVVGREKVARSDASASSITEPGTRAEQQVRFSVVAPGAVKVMLVGDFNGWDPRALPMRRSANGETWEVEVGLAPGRYTYSFVVDGRLARDPAAAEAAHDDFGVPSSVLLVKGS